MNTQKTQQKIKTKNQNKYKKLIEKNCTKIIKVRLL